jgi:hypothetical protein
MKGKIVVSLFALPFFGVGVWMLWSIGTLFADAVKMADWVPVPATVASGGYETHSGDDSNTYEAYGEYYYEFDGRGYYGNRVSIAGGADNIGDYQQDLGRMLSNARARGLTITVYVDADDPTDSVVDRSIRWGLVGFKSIFLIIFGGFGGGLLIFTWRQPPEKDKSDPRFRDRPWLLDDAWQTPTVRSSSKASMIGIWIFAAFWNLVSAPLPFLMYEEVVEKHNYIALVGLLFTIVGIGMLVWAIRRTMEWRRFGPTPVTLDPFPGSIGGHVGGTIDLNLPFDSRNEFELTLTNIKSYVSGSGKNRSRKEKAGWQDSIVAHAESSSTGGTRLSFRFDVPAGLPESDAERDDDSYTIWRLDLGAELEGANLDRSFDIPVYATATQSRGLSKLAVQRGREKQAARDDAAVRKIVRLVQDASGRRMIYPMGRNFGPSLGGFIVGATFAAIGWWLIVDQGQRIFGSIFGGTGALVAIGTLYSIFNSLEVAREAGGFQTVRRVLGIPVKRSRMGNDEFVTFTKKSNFQTQNGGKHVMHYTVRAVDNAGRALVVGEGFRGESQTEAAIRLIGQELGLRPARNTRTRRKSPALADSQSFQAL